MRTTHDHEAPESDVMQDLVDLIGLPPERLLGGGPQQEGADQRQATKQVAQVWAIAQDCTCPCSHGSPTKPCSSVRADALCGMVFSRTGKVNCYELEQQLDNVPGLAKHAKVLQGSGIRRSSIACAAMSVLQQCMCHYICG